MLVVLEKHIKNCTIPNVKHKRKCFFQDMHIITVFNERTHLKNRFISVHLHICRDSIILKMTEFILTFIQRVNSRVDLDENKVTVLIGRYIIPHYYLVNAFDWELFVIKEIMKCIDSY